jgi:FkbM family methyltransferase
MPKISRVLASKLPLRWQQELKRGYFRRQIRRARFRSNEPEYDVLERWIGAGDYVLDVGANVGHYTGRFSRLVGATGRVFAFEPIAETFELLAANAMHFGARNVTLFNAAASDGTRLLRMTAPKFDTELTNYYQASLTSGDTGIAVLCVAIDGLALPGPIKFVKIDVEGHELSVLHGMQGVLKRDRPTLMVEGEDAAVADYLRTLSYSFTKLDGSPNRIYRAQ